MTKQDKTSNTGRSQQAIDTSAALEGEVLNKHAEQSIEEKSAKGRVYSNSKATDAQSGARASQTPKKPSWFTRYRSYLLWVSLFIVVILVLFVTRPNSAWLVQHINTLQSDVSQLYKDNQALESRLAAQESKETNSQKTVESAVTEALTRTELVSQADLDGLKNSMQQQLLQLQEQFSSLSKTASLPSEDLQKSTEPSFNSEIEAQKHSDTTEASVKPLVEKFQTQIDELASRISELSDFNAHQQALTTQQALSAFQIQQWIVEINTQWVMQGRVDQTTQQLLALEQAVGLSDFPKVTTLARLIGQDLTSLALLQKSAQRDTLINTQALKEAVKTLSLNGNKASKVNNKPIMERPGAASHEKIYLGEEISSQSAFDQLMTRFGQMISLKKRETPAEQTQVESLIMHDVFIQRALLMVDRIDWALETESVNRLSIATADLQKFIMDHFEGQSPTFSRLLEPFKTLRFDFRQPLAIMTVQSEL